MIVPRADRALELRQGHVLELRAAGLVLRHARHRRGVVREPVVELAQERPSEHAVDDERERREHDDQDTQHGRGQAKAKRAHYSMAPSEYPSPRWVWRSWTAWPSSIFLRR